MLPGMELMGCQDLAVPREVMHHVVAVESGFNPYAIGVVGGRLVRQPRNAGEALATVHDLEAKGYNFSLGLAQVNRHNLKKYGLSSYEEAFASCPNLQAGARILAECHGRSGGDWGKSFSCYYSGNFVTGFRHGYVQKVFASMQSATAPGAATPPAIAIASNGAGNDKRLRRGPPGDHPSAARVADAVASLTGSGSSVHAPTAPMQVQRSQDRPGTVTKAEGQAVAVAAAVADNDGATDAAFVF